MLDYKVLRQSSVILMKKYWQDIMSFSNIESWEKRREDIIDKYGNSY